MQQEQPRYPFRDSSLYQRQDHSPLCNTTEVSSTVDWTRTEANAYHHMAMVAKKRKRVEQQPLIRVYQGGAMETGMTHVGLFDMAVVRTGLRAKGWVIETLNIKKIRE